jgi:hypothetical protein
MAKEIAVILDDYRQNEGRYMQPALGYEDDPLDSERMLGRLEQEVLLRKTIPTRTQ